MPRTSAVQQSHVVPVDVDDAFSRPLPIPLTRHETLTSVDPPHTFGYAITGIAGPLALLVDTADGEWAFTPSGAGSSATPVSWHWNLHAASPLTAPLLPVVGRLRRGYARQSLATLSAELTR